jgi:HEAT repeat protein
MSQDQARQIEALTEELRHPDEARRIAAARALGKLGVAAAVPPLMQAFAGDLGYDARDPLMSIKDPAAIPCFVEALRSDDVALRTLGAEWLTTLKRDEARPQLEALLSDADVRVRCAAIDAYAELAAPPPGPLLACLDDEAREVRWNAADALYLVARRLPAMALLAHVTDARPRVRAVLARLLARLHPVEGLPALRRLADDAHPKVRWWGQVALEEVSRPSGLEYRGPLQGHVGFAPPPDGSERF